MIRRCRAAGTALLAVGCVAVGVAGWSIYAWVISSLGALGAGGP